MQIALEFPWGFTRPGSRVVSRRVAQFSCLLLFCTLPCSGGNSDVLFCLIQLWALDLFLSMIFQGHKVSVREEEGLNSLRRSTVAVGEVFYKSMLAKIFNQSWISAVLVLGGSLTLPSCPQTRSIIWYFGASLNFFPFERFESLQLAFCNKKFSCVFWKCLSVPMISSGLRWSLLKYCAQESWYEINLRLFPSF